MSVLDGPREEWRRILFEGAPQWVRSEGENLRLGDGRTVAEADAVYLPPCDPTKIICIHLNYESRRVEFHAPPLTTPTYFQKPLTTLNSHRGKLNRPANCQYLNYEGEIAAIVGKPMRNVAPDDVWDHLAGFAPANDVGAQDFRDTDAGSMLRVKGQDGFCPIGPGIVRGIDIRESRVRTYVNGKVVQDGPVSEMTFDIPYIMPADLVAAYNLFARRRGSDRHAGELAADAARRCGGGRGHRRRPREQHGSGDTCADIPGRSPADRQRAGSACRAGAVPASNCGRASDVHSAFRVTALRRRANVRSWRRADLTSEP